MNTANQNYPMLQYLYPMTVDTKVMLLRKVEATVKNMCDIVWYFSFELQGREKLIQEYEENYSYQINIIMLMFKMYYMSKLPDGLTTSHSLKPLSARQSLKIVWHWLIDLIK